MTIIEKIDDIEKKTGFKYKKKALYLIFESIKASGIKNAEELLYTIRTKIQEKYGFLGYSVLKKWGIKETTDIGKILRIFIKESIIKADVEEIFFPDYIDLEDFIKGDYNFG